MKICVFTSTRAEYGLLRPLVHRLQGSREINLTLLITGAHLSPEFGQTISEIDPEPQRVTVEMLLSSDSSVGVAKSFGIGVLGMTDALDRIRPDWVVIAGDRSEALACAATCVMLGLPVAHIHGGEVSQGSLDEYYRHAITKLSRLHFAATREYADRIVRMGEDPRTVHNVGAIGLDNLADLELLDKQELQTALGIRFRSRNLLITYHPEHAVDVEGVLKKLDLLLEQVSSVPDALLIFTRANSDRCGRAINSRLERFVASLEARAKLFDSLGSLRYLSLLKASDAVIGNSSSGLIEAPSLGVATINVGRRQDGRTRAASVIDCEEGEVMRALERAFSPDFQQLVQRRNNPYGDGRTADRIVEILSHGLTLPPVKTFFDGLDNPLA